MTTYYIEKDEKIILADTDYARLQRTLKFKPQLADLKIKRTERPIVNCEFADTEEYLARKHKEDIAAQVNDLEAATGLKRALREIVLLEGVEVSAYVKNKAQEIENLAEELRG